MNWNKIKKAKWFLPLIVALVAVLVVGGVWAFSSWQTASIHGTGTVTVITTTTPAPVSSFNATITADSNGIGSVSGGTGNATLDTNGDSAVQHTLSVTGVSYANIANGNYGFYLQTSPNNNTASLTAYFAAAMAGNSTYIADIGNEINGSLPFFYLSIEGTSVNVYDGFETQLGNPTAPLVIGDNYPVGTYTYTGTLTGANFASNLPITINLTVSDQFSWSINGNVVTTGSPVITVTFVTPSVAIGADSSFTAVGTLNVKNLGATAIGGWTLGSITYPANITSPNLVVSNTSVASGGTATLTFTLTGTSQNTSPINFSGVTFTLTPHS